LGRLYKFRVGDNKVDFELGPSFFFSGFSLPDLAVILKHVYGGNDVEGDVDDLDRSEGCIACGGELN